MNAVNSKMSSEITENDKIINHILYLKDSIQTAQSISNLLNELDLNYKNEIGDTILMVAARKNMKEVIIIMVDYCLKNEHFNYLNNQNNQNNQF